MRRERSCAKTASGGTHTYFVGSKMAQSRCGRDGTHDSRPPGQGRARQEKPLRTQRSRQESRGEFDGKGGGRHSRGKCVSSHIHAIRPESEAGRAPESASSRRMDHSLEPNYLVHGKRAPGALAEEEPVLELLLAMCRRPRKRSWCTLPRSCGVPENA